MQQNNLCAALSIHNFFCKTKRSPSAEAYKLLVRTAPVLFVLSQPDDCFKKRMLTIQHQTFLPRISPGPSQVPFSLPPIPPLLTGESSLELQTFDKAYIHYQVIIADANRSRILTMQHQLSALHECIHADLLSSLIFNGFPPSMSSSCLQSESVVYSRFACALSDSTFDLLLRETAALSSVRFHYDAYDPAGAVFVFMFDISGAFKIMLRTSWEISRSVHACCNVWLICFVQRM